MHDAFGVDVTDTFAGLVKKPHLFLVGQLVFVDVREHIAVLGVLQEDVDFVGGLDVTLEADDVRVAEGVVQLYLFVNELSGTNGLLFNLLHGEEGTRPRAMRH